MKKSTAKTITVIVWLALGMLTLFLGDQGRLADTAVSMILLALIVASWGTYFAVEYVYRRRERFDAANPPARR